LPADFEAGRRWERLLGAGSDAGGPAATLNERYFAGRTDGLRASSGEGLLVVTA
jgi:hypothetical protein